MSRKANEETLEMMLTIRQVADFLHVSISTVRRWSYSGMLRSYRIGPRGDRRYMRDDVLRFLEGCSGYPQAGAMTEKVTAYQRRDNHLAGGEGIKDGEGKAHTS